MGGPGSHEQDTAEQTGLLRDQGQRGDITGTQELLQGISKLCIALCSCCVYGDCVCSVYHSVLLLCIWGLCVLCVPLCAPAVYMG